MRIAGVKGIVWDLDGTLLDSFGIFEAILREVVRESGHRMPTREYMILNYHGSLEETIQTLLGIKSAAELAKVAEVFLDKQLGHYTGNLNAHLFNDATQLAQQAAKLGIMQVLVTNRFHANRGNASPKAIVAATVLADCINEVRAGDEVAFRKPDKRTVQDWLEKHGIAPRELLVVGDQFVDAELAANIGARVLLVRRNGEIPHLKDILAKHIEDTLVVDSLHDIELKLA
jgi:phosphoglycolate phosphatase-like HAD superfamily hydrolase